MQCGQDVDRVAETMRDQRGLSERGTGPTPDKEGRAGTAGTARYACGIPDTEEVAGSIPVSLTHRIGPDEFGAFSFNRIGPPTARNTRRHPQRGETQTKEIRTYCRGERPFGTLRRQISFVLLGGPGCWVLTRPAGCRITPKRRTNRPWSSKRSSRPSAK